MLALFTSGERARSFVKDFPRFGAGMLTDLKAITKRWGVDCIIALNPGVRVGVDLPRELVRQLDRVPLADAAAPVNQGIPQ